jgi:multiple sugar transport system substrate-binding protein
LAEWASVNPAHPEGFADSMLTMVMDHSKPAWTITTKNQSELDALITSALDPVWQGQQSAKDAMTALEPSLASKIQGRYDN